MIVFPVLMVWIAAANSPSQLAYAAVGLFLRIAYMNFAFPPLPRFFFIAWATIALISFAVVPEMTVRDAFQLFMKISLGGFLMLHMAKRLSQSPLIQVPLVREVWLAIGRGAAMLPAKIDEMRIYASQQMRAQRRKLLPTRGVLGYIFSQISLRISQLRIYGGLAISLMVQTLLLRERQFLVLEARGNFPVGDLPSFGGNRDRRDSIGPLIGDTFLCLLLAAPVIVADASLVPVEITHVVQSILSLFGGWIKWLS